MKRALRLDGIESAFLLHALSFVSSRGFPVVAYVVAAALLGPDNFGMFIAAIGIYAALLVLVDAGLSVATTTLVARRRIDGSKLAARGFLVAISACLVLGLVLSCVLLLNATGWARLLFDDSTAVETIYAGAVYIPAAALVLVFQGGLAGLQRYDKAATGGVAGGLLYLLLVVGCASVGGASTALWGAAVGMVCRAVLLAFLTGRMLRKAARTSERRELIEDVRALGVISVPAILASLAFAPTVAFLLSSVLRHPNGPAEAGGLGLALQIFGIALILPSIITQFALPRLAALEGPEASAQRKRIVLKYASASLIVTAALALPLAAFSSSVLLVLGSEYSPFATTLQLMMLAAIFSAPQGIFSNYMLAAGKYWWRVVSFAGWGIVVVSTMLVLADNSARSAAIAYTLGWALLCLSQGFAVAVHLRRSEGAPASAPA